MTTETYDFVSVMMEPFEANENLVEASRHHYWAKDRWEKARNRYDDMTAQDKQDE